MAPSHHAAAREAVADVVTLDLGGGLAVLGSNLFARDIGEQMAHDLAVAHGVISLPKIGHVEAHVLAQQFDQAGSDVERFHHDHGQHAQHGSVVQRDLSTDQTTDTLSVWIAAGDGRRVGIEVEQAQNPAPPGIEQGFRKAFFNALGPAVHRASSLTPEASPPARPVTSLPRCGPRRRGYRARPTQAAPGAVLIGLTAQADSRGNIGYKQLIA
ncbi:hypothetical protein [Novosphingobium sp. B-7]|uniref:hypothetical protein n=1 Tax=Novosphingobium sp. B-7 TaxID=1298855 RepID=UPI0011D1F01D|nr:hypothetical protein [Novosphingobium sp. B-7]